MSDFCSNAVGYESTMFNPVLSKQRYVKVADILRAEAVTQVVDFGCGGCKMFPHLKQVASIEDIKGVDCDRDQLDSKRFMVKPLLSEFQDRYRRKNPLTIKTYHGSLVQFDSRLHNSDAVILIEVIEHLHSEELAAMPKVLFGEIYPRIIVITTPNEEFNILFPNFSGMRNEDHKFEWTRDEFQQWCGVQALEYGYSVEFDGVGEHPGGRRDLGHCSQLAVFHRLDESRGRCINSQENFTYELISEGHFPLKEDSFTKDETILMGAKFYMKMVARHHPDGDSSGNAVSVSLHKLIGYPDLKDVCPDVNTLREVLERANYKFSTDNESVLFVEEDDDEDYISGETEDITYCTEIIDQTEPKCCCDQNQETLSESVDEWTLDDPPQTPVDTDTWCLDDVSQGQTQELAETVPDLDGLECHSHTLYELEEEMWTPEDKTEDARKHDFLERSCCARADRLKFEVSAPECGQFSDAEDDEDANTVISGQRDVYGQRVT